MVLFLISVTVCGYHFVHTCVLYYSAEKAISTSSLKEFPVKLLLLFKAQMCHFAENVSVSER